MHSIAALLFSHIVVVTAIYDPLLQFFEDEKIRLAELLDGAPNIEQRDSVPASYFSPPYYPTPKGGWISSWADSYAKAAKLVANMTLAEKVNVTSGTGFLMDRCTGNTGSVDRLGFPAFCLQDSALGIGRTDGITAFPAGITVGATFNKDLMFDRGSAIGEEARGKGVNVQLGPAVGPLGRKPRGGRNWETFGSDPTLQAFGGSETIKGMQSQGVIATIKHFILNEQEMYRMDLPIPHGVMKALSSNIDDRSLHELYIWPFAEGIRAGVGAVMSAYNDVNGSACSENSKLLNGILKDELGFQGLVMTDWFAQVTGVASALSGNDMAMPGDGAIPLLGLTYWASELSKSVINGSVPIDRLNDMATRVVATWYQLGQDKDYPPPNFSANTADASGPCHPGALISPTCQVNEFVDVQSTHKDVVRQIAREAVTVLKNDGNVLPLKSTTSLKVFGSSAQVNPDGANACEDRSCNKGVLGMGWGTGTANYPYLDAPIDALRRAATNVTYYSSDTYPSSATASPNDVALVFLTSDSGENSRTVENNHGDRDSDGLYAWHGGDDLVKQVAAKFSTVIVIVHTVGPLVLENWISLPSVKSVVFAHLPGQEAGDSLTDILFGNFSPSGHLPYSIPVKENDYPDSLSLRGFAFGQVQDTFSEGLYIDYRWLNKAKIKPRFPFGHGLSYTTFSYSSLSLQAGTSLSTFPPSRAPKDTSSIPVYSSASPSPLEVAWPPKLNRINRYLYPYLDNPSQYVTSAKYAYPNGYSTTPHPAPRAGGGLGGNPALWDIVFTLSVSVTNTGRVAGKSVVLLFVSFPSASQSSFETPIIQLRNFAKTDTLQPGASETVQLTITRKDLSVWDTVVQDWRIPDLSGSYTFWVGNSSAGLTWACDSTGGGCSGGRTPPV